MTIIKAAELVLSSYTTPERYADNASASSLHLVQVNPNVVYG